MKHDWNTIGDFVSGMELGLNLDRQREKTFLIIKSQGNFLLD